MSAASAPTASLYERVTSTRHTDVRTSPATVTREMALDSRYRCVTTFTGARSSAPIRIGVKDTIDVAGLPTRLGLPHYRSYPAVTSPLVPCSGVSQVIAKLVTTELNIGAVSGCLNPAFPRVNPAGSSTGCGVAVAADIVDLALGTDVLGSIRWPASRCGTVGLRMSMRGRRAMTGVLPLVSEFDAPGWIARTAEDLDFGLRTLGLIAKYDQSALFGGSRTPAVQLTTPTEVYQDGALGEHVAAALKEFLGRIQSPTLSTETRPSGALWTARADAWDLCGWNAWNRYVQSEDRFSDTLSPSTERSLSMGQQVGHVGAEDARQRVLSVRTRREEYVREASHPDGPRLMVLPVEPNVGAAYSPSEDQLSATFPDRASAHYAADLAYTPLASILGCPAITFPVQKGSSRATPIALQLVGAPGDDWLLIELVKIWERGGVTL